MLSSRLKAFVIPTSQTSPIASRSSRCDHLDRQPGDEHDSRSRELGRESLDGSSGEVVHEPGQEEDRAACEDAASSAVGSTAPTAPAAPTP